MAPTDPHQGADLFDMAAKGTSIPNDAGEMNVIPSKPRPGEADRGGATNPTDIPRSFRDREAGLEVETGTGDLLPSQVESKRLHHFGNDDSAKGGVRYDKHVRQKESDQDKYATEGSNVNLQPSEEERRAETDQPDEEVERIIDSRERERD